MSTISDAFAARILKAHGYDLLEPVGGEITKPEKNKHYKGDMNQAMRDTAHEAADNTKRCFLKQKLVMTQ